MGLQALRLVPEREQVRISMVLFDPQQTGGIEEDATLLAIAPKGSWRRARRGFPDLGSDRQPVFAATEQRRRYRRPSRRVGSRTWPATGPRRNASGAQ